MGSRCLYSSLRLELADRREKLIPSSCDSISGLLTVARHQVSATEGSGIQRYRTEGTVDKDTGLYQKARILRASPQPAKEFQRYNQLWGWEQQSLKYWFYYLSP